MPAGSNRTSWTPPGRWVADSSTSKRLPSGTQTDAADPGQTTLLFPEHVRPPRCSGPVRPLKFSGRGRRRRVPLNGRRFTVGTSLDAVVTSPRPRLPMSRTRSRRSHRAARPSTRAGTNVFAVEVHQAKIPGGDVVFDAR